LFCFIHNLNCTRCFNTSYSTVMWPHYYLRYCVLMYVTIWFMMCYLRFFIFHSILRYPLRLMYFLIFHSILCYFNCVMYIFMLRFLFSITCVNSIVIKFLLHVMIDYLMIFICCNYVMLCYRLYQWWSVFYVITS
jgi:hypothetical protein